MKLDMYADYKDNAEYLTDLIGRGKNAFTEFHNHMSKYSRHSRFRSVGKMCDAINRYRVAKSMNMDDLLNELRVAEKFLNSMITNKDACLCLISIQSTYNLLKHYDSEYLKSDMKDKIISCIKVLSIPIIIYVVLYLYYILRMKGIA